MAKTSHLRADGGSNIPSPRGSDDDLSATPIFDGPARAFFQIECEIGLHRANGVGHVLAHAARFLAACAIPFPPSRLPRRLPPSAKTRSSRKNVCARTEGRCGH
jgi:hypothetical protein